jgi:hypothetical protein
MSYEINYTDEAESNLLELRKQGRFDKLKKIKNTISKLKENPKHPGLHTHKNNSIKNPFDRETFQSYVENRTPGAFRVFWCYGPKKDEITIFSITPHP